MKAIGNQVKEDDLRLKLLGGLVHFTPESFDASSQNLAKIPTADDFEPPSAAVENILNHCKTESLKELIYKYQYLFDGKKITACLTDPSSAEKTRGDGIALFRDLMNLHVLKIPERKLAAASIELDDITAILNLIGNGPLGKELLVGPVPYIPPKDDKTTVLPYYSLESYGDCMEFYTKASADRPHNSVFLQTACQELIDGLMVRKPDELMSQNAWNAKRVADLTKTQGGSVKTFIIDTMKSSTGDEIALSIFCSLKSEYMKAIDLDDFGIDVLFSKNRKIPDDQLLKSMRHSLHKIDVLMGEAKFNNTLKPAQMDVLRDLEMITQKLMTSPFANKKLLAVEVEKKHIDFSLSHFDEDLTDDELKKRFNEGYEFYKTIENKTYDYGRLVKVSYNQILSQLLAQIKDGYRLAFYDLHHPS